jgi:hypothetical protein
VKQRIIPVVLLLGLAGCSSQPLDKEQALKNLKSQAEEVRQAMLEEDHQKMADLTHPTLVEKMGGKARFVQRLESMAGEMKGQGIRLKDMTFSKPSDLVESSGDVYAVVPYKMEIAGLEGAHPSYLIGVSTDRGGTWKFIDGAGVGGDRGKL